MQICSFAVVTILSIAAQAQPSPHGSPPRALYEQRQEVMANGPGNTTPKQQCMMDLKYGPDALIDPSKPRPTPFQVMHALNEATSQIVAFGQGGTTTIYSEKGSVSVNGSSCKPQGVKAGEYIAQVFADYANFAKRPSTDKKVVSWIVDFFDHCSKVYPDVEAMRAKANELRSNAGSEQKTSPVTR